MRYCTLKLEDNDAQLRLMRREAGRLLLRGVLILLICVGVSSVFRSEALTFLPPLINSALGEGFNVIGWVMLWRPGGDVLFRSDPDPHVKRGSSVSEVPADRDSSAAARGADCSIKSGANGGSALMA